MTKPTPHLKRVSKNDLPDDMKQSWDQANDLTGDATSLKYQVTTQMYTDGTLMSSIKSYFIRID